MTFLNAFIAGAKGDCNKDGFRRHPSNCKIFYVCSEDGMLYEFRCPGMLLFNIAKGQCDQITSVPECLDNTDLNQDRTNDGSQTIEPSQILNRPLKLPSSATSPPVRNRGRT